jgi:hypothetical protein
MEQSHRKSIAAISLALAALQPLPAPAAPANSLQDLWAELNSCLRGAQASEGLDVTVVMSLKRDGSLLGKPRITHSKLPDDPAARQRDADALARALDKCLPLSITDALGGAIAGRPFSIRIVGRKKATET